MKLITVLTALFMCFSLKADTGIDNSLLKEANTGVSKGVSFLLSKQNENGSWGPYGGMPAVTAIVVNALAGTPEADSKKVKEAIGKSENGVMDLNLGQAGAF